MTRPTICPQCKRKHISTGRNGKETITYCKDCGYVITRIPSN